MIECILAWIMLFIGIAEGTADWFIACGVFAIASQLYQLNNKGE